MQLLKRITRDLNGLSFPNVGTDIRTLTTLAPERVSIDRRGFTLVAGIKKKATVFEGMPLATHPDKGKGDLVVPLTGEVAELSDDVIVIAKSTAVAGESPEMERAEVSPDMPREELAAALKRAGLDTDFLTHEAETVIVNAIPPDPAVTWQCAAFEQQTEVMRAGFAFLAGTYQGKVLKLAVPSAMPFVMDGFETVGLDDTIYPAGLDDLVAARVTGVEKGDGVLVLPLHLVWQLGVVATTGRPLTRTVLTVGSAKRAVQYVATIGTTAEMALSAAGLILKSGDALVVNGAMRGESWSNPYRGVRAGTEGLYLREFGDVPEYAGDGPCMNCGACAEVCPARLEPGRLSRFAEAGMLDDCRKHHIFYCLECGLCTYVCPAMRPVMQYLRIARQRMN